MYRHLPHHCCYLAATSAVMLAGCRVYEPQSTLHPAGPAAAAIAGLWWGMFFAFTAVFLLVLVLLAVALVRGSPDERPAPPLGNTGFIVAGGIALPVVVLTPLLIWSLETSAALRTPDDAPTIEVVGRMWWWEVRHSEQQIVTANELYIPVGQPVRLKLTSADVIHSFWVPSLHGKRDMIPGLQTTFWIQADRPGIYRGQCAEYCGVQHANMAFVVVALPADEFEAWSAQRSTSRSGLPSRTSDGQRDTAQPLDPMVSPGAFPAPARQAGPADAAQPLTPIQRGRQVFFDAGCAKCHAIRGTPAIGVAGPDLTHIGSRRTLAAGMLPNNFGNLTGWIANPQGIKPGAKMPPTYLPPQSLFDLASYLETLQ